MKDQKENLIQRYLLDELPEAEQTAFEQELLADRVKFDQVWASESALIDSYVRGEMSRADRARFEGRYLASPLHRERVAIAELFLNELEERQAEVTDAARAPTPARSWWSQLWAFLPQPHLALGAAVAILACGVGWLYVERTRLTEQYAKLQDEARTERSARQRREQELALRTKELEKENDRRRQENEQLNTELERLRRQPAEPPVLLAFLLTPGASRSQNTPPPQIPRVTRPIQLLMELTGSNYPSYQFRLQTVEGREILSQSSRAGSSQTRAFATLTLPAGRLGKGDYVLILSGRTAKGTEEELDRYFFQVK